MLFLQHKCSRLKWMEVKVLSRTGQVFVCVCLSYYSSANLCVVLVCVGVCVWVCVCNDLCLSTSALKGIKHYQWLHLPRTLKLCVSFLLTLFPLPSTEPLHFLYRFILYFTLWSSSPSFLFLVSVQTNQFALHCTYFSPGEALSEHSSTEKMFCFPPPPPSF